MHSLFNYLHNATRGEQFFEIISKIIQLGHWPRLMVHRSSISAKIILIYSINNFRLPFAATFR